MWLDDKSDSLSYQASPRSDTSFDLDCIRPESVSTAYDSDSDDYGDEEDLTDAHTGKAKVCLPSQSALGNWSASARHADHPF